MAWLKAAEAALPKLWPEELPPESTPDFWFTACKHEMATRNLLSEKLRSLAEGKGVEPLTLLEAWLFRRRIEWASQLALGAAKKGMEPDASLPEVLQWALVETWQTDGCIGMWKHAERDGKPHPDNPDGLAPLP